MLGADLLLHTDRRLQGIANPKRCFIWSVLTKTQTQTVDIPVGRFRTTKSSWPKSTEHRQCTDNLAQAGRDRSESRSVMCAGATLHPCPASKRGSRQDVCRVQTGADERQQVLMWWPRHKWPCGWTFANFVVLHCLTLQGSHVIQLPTVRLCKKKKWKR